jgi:alpha-beta hydrolase superfamily lysophospholipase
MRLRAIWRSRWGRGTLSLLLLGTVGVNALAWMQARAMTHFATGGEKTATIEALSPSEKVRAIVLGVTVPRPSNSHTPGDLGLSFTTEKIPIAEREWLEVWSIQHANGRGVVVMLPGYATSKESLLSPAKVIYDQGFSVLLVDFRGVGGSSGDETTLGVREAADVARAVIFAQQTWPGQPLILYGVSMGGAAVLRAGAVEGVRPAAIVLESPFDSLLVTAGNRFHALGLPATPGAELLVFWGSVQLGYNGFAHNPRDYARAVTCPVLLLHGDRDPRVTTAQARSLQAHLGGPSEFVSFPDASHELLLTTAPQAWTTAVTQFLDRNTPAK